MKPHQQHYDLVEACKTGNRRAQFKLYNMYSKAMYNICYRMMGNKEEGEDVLQNAFVDVFMKIDSFRHESTIGAWIKRIVINHNINALKKRRMIFVDWDDRILDKEDDAYLPEEEEVEEINKIKKAIHALPDGYRVVFNLYLMEGYDHKEIAEILNISEGASKSQYSRAKRKIRTLISDKSQTG